MEVDDDVMDYVNHYLSLPKGINPRHTQPTDILWRTAWALWNLMKGRECLAEIQWPLMENDWE